MTTNKLKLSKNPSIATSSGYKAAKSRLHGKKPKRQRNHFGDQTVLSKRANSKWADNMRKMRIKKPYYDAIMSGRKTLEVRVGYGSIKRLRAGKLLQLETSCEFGTVRIKSIRIYDNFAKMLAAEDWRQIVPQAKNKAEALRLLQKIYPPRKEKLGVHVIEIEKS